MFLVFFSFFVTNIVIATDVASPESPVTIDVVVSTLTTTTTAAVAEGNRVGGSGCWLML